MQDWRGPGEPLWTWKSMAPEVERTKVDGRFARWSLRIPGAGIGAAIGLAVWVAALPATPLPVLASTVNGLVLGYLYAGSLDVRNVNRTIWSMAFVAIPPGMFAFGLLMADSAAGDPGLVEVLGYAAFMALTLTLIGAPFGLPVTLAAAAVWARSMERATREFGPPGPVIPWPHAAVIPLQGAEPAEGRARERGR